MLTCSGRKRTMLSAKYFPGQILNCKRHYSLLKHRTAALPYRRPNPNATLLGSLGERSPGLGRKRSGLKISGSGYSSGSWSIALKTGFRDGCISYPKWGVMNAPLIRNDRSFCWDTEASINILIFCSVCCPHWQGRVPSEEIDLIYATEGRIRWTDLRTSLIRASQ